MGHAYCIYSTNQYQPIRKLSTISSNAPFTFPRQYSPRRKLVPRVSRHSQVQHTYKNPLPSSTIIAVGVDGKMIINPPFYAFHGRRWDPGYKHLRLFGFLGFVHSRWRRKSVMRARFHQSAKSLPKANPELFPRYSNDAVRVWKLINLHTHHVNNHHDIFSLNRQCLSV